MCVVKCQNENLDIKENHLYDLDKRLLSILLKDNTTKKNKMY